MLLEKVVENRQGAGDTHMAEQAEWRFCLIVYPSYILHKLVL